ncbi:MAG TPA: histidine kinase [bacterium]|jgi:PAS domain S-box-containing protein|nr:histidine kinase [bacterium]
MPKRRDATLSPLSTFSERLSLAPLSTFFEASLDGILLLDEEGRYLHANPTACQLMGYSLEELKARDLFMNTPPHAQEAMRKHLAEVRAKAAAGHSRPQLGSGSLLRATGEEREIEWIVAPFLMDGRKLAVVMFHDVTDAHRLARKAEALRQIASTVAVAGSLEETLATVARAVVEASGSIYCGLFLIDEKDKSVRVYGGYGEGHPIKGEKEAWEAVVRAGAPAPGFEAVERGEPVILHDLGERLLADPRYALVHPFIRDDLTKCASTTVANLPMRYGKRILGWMNVTYTPRRDPSDAEIAFLGAIADHAAVASEIARLLVEAREKAALEERQRLARELHDSVSQALYGIALGARTARTLLDRDPAQATEPLDYVLSLAEAGLAEMRALIFELRPESLKEEGLIAALTKQIDSARARHKISVQADLPAEPAIPLESKETVYRIAQEALANTVRHARANRVTLQVDGGPADIVLEVADDGVGFDTNGSYPGHLGLRSMQERAAAAGGSLEVDSAPGRGTRIRAKIPIENGL